MYDTTGHKSALVKISKKKKTFQWQKSNFHNIVKNFPVFLKKIYTTNCETVPTLKVIKQIA